MVIASYIGKQLSNKTSGGCTLDGRVFGESLIKYYHQLLFGDKDNKKKTPLITKYNWERKRLSNISP